MKILLNNEPLDGVATGDRTLGDVLLTVQNEHMGEDRVISAVFVDGEPLTGELLGQWRDRPCSELGEVRIDAPDRRGLAVNGLRVLARGLEESQRDRAQIVELFNQGRASEAMNALTGYLTLWNNTQLSLASAGRLLAVELDALEMPTGTVSAPISKHLNELTEQLGGLKAALEAEDLVLLADILAYEFEPLAQAWQNMLNRLADYFEQAPA